MLFALSVAIVKIICQEELTVYPHLYSQLLILYSDNRGGAKPFLLSSKNGYKSSDIHVVVLKLNYALTICCLSFIDGRSMNDNKLIFMAKFIIGFYISHICFLI